MALVQEEIDGCKAAYYSVDKNHRGTISLSELRQLLIGMGELQTDEEFEEMLTNVDQTGTISFTQFLTLIQSLKKRAESLNDENDMLEAFVACGGDPDKGGFVSRDNLINIVKNDFGLPIDIEALINKVDTDGSGEIEFDEFKEMMLPPVKDDDESTR